MEIRGVWALVVVRTWFTILIHESGMETRKGDVMDVEYTSSAVALGLYAGPEMENITNICFSRAHKPAGRR